MSAPDLVSLHALRVRGHHGVLPAERADGQDFVVDVDLSLDVAPAARTDDLARTVDYGALAHALAADVAAEPVDLLETLADRLAVRCLVASPVVVAARVRVTKPVLPVDLDLGGASVTVRRRRLVAAVGLGSNLGDRERHLADAVALLDATPGVRVTAVSGVVETDPVGGPEQGRYLNAVATCEVASARVLLAAAQTAEAAAGRERGERWGPRTLDVDLLAAGDEAWSEPDLVLPHPRAHERAFVLLPWAELEPGRRLAGRTVAELAAAAGTTGVDPRPDVDLRPLRLPTAEGAGA